MKQTSNQWNINTQMTKSSWCNTNLLRLISEEINHTFFQNKKYSLFLFVQH